MKTEDIKIPLRVILAESRKWRNAHGEIKDFDDPRKLSETILHMETAMRRILREALVVESILDVSQ